MRNVKGAQQILCVVSALYQNEEINEKERDRYAAEVKKYLKTGNGDELRNHLEKTRSVSAFRELINGAIQII